MIVQGFVLELLSDAIRFPEAGNRIRENSDE